ncbi:fumarate hydratase [candidate division LCP-89 bacterium B3_LCP]|uniref:Fumarate hydratase n=1 Tax=candidate division LCP-89 bacterium B3_LCP TaxID=2012998 RepID=A0A532V0P0_UNCL8|nr:MAG: fumarate hydratase [candidate division LCP-89 bacterium B3_LCP]
MRTIHADKITEVVADLCMNANYHLGDDIYQALQDFRAKEESPVAIELLEQCIKNAQIAHEDEVPICQDTGFAVFFVEMGDQVTIDGNLTEAISKGVAKGYTDGYLRKSIVEDPLRRKNTGDNTPPIIWTDMIPGDGFKITIAPKGGGSENMSEVKMLKPSDGEEGVKDFVVDRIKRSGANPCPPVIVGVGIGGTYDKCAWLSKKALLREIGSKHPDPYYAAMEDELLERINKLGIGPQGLGGRTTALAVFIEAHPCHIASLPAAVNVQCHAARHKSVEL